MKTDQREHFLLALIYLLQEETSCLRSVLSETEEDKTSYIQFVRADILREAIETLEHSL